jgi:hypothetical protein
MRTTVTQDTAIAKKLQELAHLKKTSFKEILNHVLRRGLSAGSASGPDPEFVVAAHKGGFRPGIDPLKLNQLIDQMEVEDLAAETQHEPHDSS